MLRRILFLALIALLVLSCASVMMKVGQIAQSALTVKTADVSDATPVIKLYNNNRPYPITNTMQEYAKSKGMEVSDGFRSAVTFLLTKGMKFVDFDGVIRCNGQEMNYYGAGMYMVETPVKSGSKFTFALEGTDQNPIRFTRIYRGEKVTLLAPKAGEEIDLSKGFEVKWTPGNHPQKGVKISLVVTQLGLENIVPVAIFPDNGQARITPQMLAELKLPGQKIKTGQNFIILERQKDEFFSALNGDGICSSIDADAVAVEFKNSPPDPVRPVLKGFTVKEGDVELTVSDYQSKYNPYGGMLVSLDQIKKVALTSFAIKGFTAATKKTSYAIYSYWADLGEKNLQKTVNLMADKFMKELNAALNMEQVPTQKVLQSRGYQKMSKIETRSDKNSFYAIAHGLTTFDGLSQMQFKIGGIESWYYDIAKSSGADALLEVYFTLFRQKPKHTNEFTFDILVDIRNKIYPYNIIMRGGMPSMHAKWTSESFEIEETTFDAEEFLKAIKFDQFVKTYIQALEQLKQKENQLTI